MAELVFMALLAAHVVHAVVTNRAESIPPLGTPPGTPWTVLSQTPLFLLACYLGASYGIFTRQLISPVYFALGLAAGHLIFCISVMVIHRSAKAAGELLASIRDIARFAVDSPAVLSRFVSVAFAEELIYRGVGQPLLIEWTGSPWLGIPLLAVLFSVVHHHFFRNEFLVSIEFLGFGLLLGGLYHLTGSILLVMVIHAVRDIEIAFLEYVEKYFEFGEDEERALDTIERMYLPNLAERS